MPPNYNFNHVGISVPNFDEAINFYTSLFGFRVVWKMEDYLGRDFEPGSTMNKIYGPEIKTARIAFLTMGNGVGFEIFEFIEPRYTGPEKTPEFSPADYLRGGFFHICLTVPDPDVLCAEALKLGAKQIGVTTYPAIGEKAVYIQDPWGNIVELLTCAFEHILLAGDT